MALQKTALTEWHRAKGAKMVEFTGYEMPVQYSEGIIKEHLWTRSHASLFDVSHMGQILIRGADVAEKLERIMPMDFLSLPVGKQRYALLLNDQGTIEDDLMVTRRADDFYLVVNASRKEHDFAILQKTFGDAMQWWQDRALIALQGPKSAAVLSVLNPAVKDLKFMQAGMFKILEEDCWVSRSGYTGEDGFEISIPAKIAMALANALLSDSRVHPAGLGARDSLRLEAGLCLYGNDIDTTTTPIEAGIAWAIQKVRKPEGEREGGYPGAEIIAQHIKNGVARRRVGFSIEGKLPVRQHTKIFHNDKEVGEITSGGFAATLDAPVAMGYVDSELATTGTEFVAMVRNKAIKMQIVDLPFVKKDYKS
ncbi:glycine cleavage system aminomethyltransferase GcvT [Dichelobacter nodosus]|uniref:aminomethyltransferase n=1 Tax=Dichelobacter nodosus (strain VCS1703A) TaxID=246195 RepID=A5EXE6_DICNV|nr:glycine cleavage system aminomethyltransferase GcvT [Dichelobacter nodosus]ABQ13850.1 glycine cleavage system T protein [Dichelobacter nodosus VCS1703A]AXM45967.1 glycine cleavage system aminomethyltransferase GcvT [Dichelobacter nodosus]KNZ39126.1 glycine cleavage system protein T [Dichelobacter nodosus]TGA64581.1 glycine cleavage system aminomethyltransferase GcvT [Dichelobacter nodosus]